MSRYFERVYLCNILLGLLIYLCFPNSTVLWQFLALYGIQFNGDPHTGRFVSTYLDPNYFGAIASIPLMLSYNVYQNHAKKKGGWKIVLIFLVAIMTLSRSGIMTLLLIISWIFFHKFLKVTYFAIKTKSIMVFFILLLVFSGLAIANSSSIIYFFDRSIHMNSDPSALGRLHSFQWGLNLISEHPLLGIGYNNLNLYLNDPIKGRTAIDSSLILTIISFGIPLASFLLSAILIWAIWVLMRLKSLGREYSTFCFFFKSMFFYLFVCIFFTSHFNNLLYYPFWLIPIISIFSYLMCCLKEIDQKKFFISSGVC